LWDCVQKISLTRGAGFFCSCLFLKRLVSNHASWVDSGGFSWKSTEALCYLRNLCLGMSRFHGTSRGSTPSLGLSEPVARAAPCSRRGVNEMILCQRSAGQGCKPWLGGQGSRSVRRQNSWSPDPRSQQQGAASGKCPGPHKDPIPWLKRNPNSRVLNLQMDTALPKSQSWGSGPPKKGETKASLGSQRRCTYNQLFSCCHTLFFWVDFYLGISRAFWLLERLWG
jgi:hypothetical protein